MKLAFDLSLKKGDFTLKAQAEIPAESVTAIVGPSGSGKSTLLRCIAGLEPAARGVLQAGEESWLQGERSLAPSFRRIGFVFQHAALFEHLSVFKNLAYARKRALNDEGYSLAEIARATRIDHLLARQTDSLSGGERQRVAIARAIASNPQLLLLDEPLSAVDDTARGELSQELAQIFRAFQIPALYVTHQLPEAARLCTHALRLQSGQVTAQGPISVVLAPDGASDAPFSIVSLSASRALPDEGLIELESALGPLLLPANARSGKLPPRLVIPARDVGLSLAPLPGSSFLNQIPATVQAVEFTAAGQVLVHLSCNNVALYALLTQRSSDHLKLAPGLPVWALVKSVSLEQA